MTATLATPNPLGHKDGNRMVQEKSELSRRTATERFYDYVDFVLGVDVMCEALSAMACMERPAQRGANTPIGETWREPDPLVE
jgi:hypothetical protein